MGSGREKTGKNTDGNEKQVEHHSGTSLFPKKWPRLPQLGPQNGAKMVQKSMQKSIKILMVFGIVFWRDFGGLLEPKWSQVGAKIDPNWNVVLEAIFGWMLGTFFTVLQHMLRLPKYVKILKT